MRKTRPHRIPAIMALASLACCGPAIASQKADVHSHHPSTNSRSAQSSRIVRLSDGSLAFIPAELRSSAPALVLLHGAGGDARGFLDLFKDEANRRQFVAVALQSNGVTWPKRTPQPNSREAASVGAALNELDAEVPLDRTRTTVLGFSDGASYALTLGLARPDLFRTIIALSPGYAFAPGKLDLTQRLFIAHGRRDRVLPAANTRSIVEGLERAGYRPQVRWFEGGHEIDQRTLNAILDEALTPAQEPPKSGTGGAMR